MVANTREGSYHTFINNASIGYRSKKWAMIASGNYQDRDRTQTSYFEFYRNKWLEQPDYFINYIRDTVRNVHELYPDPEQAMKKYAGNIFLNYDVAEMIKFNFSAGIQHSMSTVDYRLLARISAIFHIGQKGLGHDHVLQQNCQSKYYHEHLAHRSRRLRPGPGGPPPHPDPAA